MTAQLATIAFLLGIIALFRLDRDSAMRPSIAIWIPMTWLAIGGSRVVSAWLNPYADISAGEAYLEGNPTDRNVQATLMLLGVMVLFQRRDRVVQILRANLPVLIFFVYCGFSIIWSDFAGVALRRWIKAIGDLVMVLVVLSDRDQGAALKLPARVGFVLIPASILLMKYYPDLARAYDKITGDPEYSGVATSKNGLGMVCMIFGLGAVWRFLEALAGKDPVGRKGRLLAHGLVVAMAIWLFLWAHSMTSLACFLIALSLIVATGRSAVVHRPPLVHVLFGSFLLATVSVLFLGVGGGLLESLGRNSSLTGRTEIWSHVLGMVVNPVLGTGFESFWLGERLERMLSVYRAINQAHNGYIEIYLNLGWVGIGLLAALLATGYRNILTSFREDPDLGRLRLAYFFIGVAVNFTEASFKMMSPVWVFLLMSVMAIPRVTALAPSRRLAPARPEPARRQQAPASRGRVRDRRGEARL
jgi:exopolysaccharide production protein ExoQ